MIGLTVSTATLEGIGLDAGNPVSGKSIAILEKELASTGYWW